MENNISWIRWTNKPGNLERVSEFLGDAYDHYYAERHFNGRCEVHCTINDKKLVVQRNGWLIKYKTDIIIYNDSDEFCKFLLLLLNKED